MPQENVYIARGKDPRKIKEELMAEGEEAIEFFSIAEPIELTSDTDEDLVGASGEPYRVPRDYTRDCLAVAARQPVGRCGQCWQSWMACG